MADAAAPADKGISWGWIIFWIALGLILIGGVYYFFFSTQAKKKSLFKKVIAKHPELKIEALIKQFEKKSYDETLKSINATYPTDKY